MNLEPLLPNRRKTYQMNLFENAWPWEVHLLVYVGRVVAVLDAFG